MGSDNIHSFLNTLIKIFKKIGSALYTALCFVVGLVAKIIHTSRVAAIIILVVIVVLIGVIVDGVSTADKIYAGVSIGDVNVSNMTKDEATQAVEEHYQSNIDDYDVVVFINEEVAASADTENRLVEYEPIGGQISFAEAQENKILWIENSYTLGVSFPVEEMVQEAFNVGRDEEGIGERISASIQGRIIEPTITFNDDELSALVDDINLTLGTGHVDCSIVMDGGVASIVVGHDGEELDKGWLAGRMQEDILSGSDPHDSIVVQSSYAPMKIDEEAAQNTCDAVNTLISNGVSFIFNNVPYEITRETLGSWVDTNIIETDTGYRLAPYLNERIATPALVNIMNEALTESQVMVEFNVNGDDITVIPQSAVTVPLFGDAVSELDYDLFDQYRSDGSIGFVPPLTIVVETQQVSDPMDFETASDYGAISVISTFTTEFVNTTATANRAHNIQLAADLLNNSVAKANGGTWSFNDIAGDCNEDRGFLSAGAIAGNEHVEEAGGGICQVATTVFNAAYEAGYPILQRTNHSLYVATYPAGRDAAIAFPDLDLVWENDTPSDVLVCTSYTDTSVTVTLYGVSPRYVVETQTGDWQEGAHYTTSTIVDDTLSPGTRYIDTAGADGMDIVVYRTVYDSNGAILHEDVFDSYYEPVTEVIVVGPDA